MGGSLHQVEQCQMRAIGKLMLILTSSAILHAHAAVQMIVGRPAFSQSAKGVVSVGPIRGLRYVWPKLKKKWAPGK